MPATQSPAASMSGRPSRPKRVSAYVPSSRRAAVRPAANEPVRRRPQADVASAMTASPSALGRRTRKGVTSPKTAAGAATSQMYSGGLFA